MSQTGGGGGQPTQGGYATRPGPRHNQQHHGHQQPNPAAAWGAPTADPYAAAAYQQQQAAAAAAYAGYGYQMKDVSVAGGYGAMPQVQGYYVPAGVAQQTMGGWDGFGGFGYAAQPSTAAAQYAAAGAYGQPGYGLYGSAFGPVYGQPQQQQMMAQQYQQQQQQQQQVQQAQQGQRGAAGQQNAIGYKAAVGGAIGSKPSLAVASTADQQKTSPVLANSGIAGANGEATDVEIVGGYGPGTVPGGGADKLSASNSVASELGKDVYEQAAGAGTATTTANKSPFGPGMFFGAIGSYEGLDGTGGAVPPEDETEWRDYEARFGIDDLLGGLGGSGSAPVNVTTGAGTVAMPASAPLTSGPPPGLGPIARNGSIGEIANGGGSAISPVGAAAAAANSGDAFQFPSWGTSIGALGGMLGDAGAQTSFGSVGSAGQSDLVASVVQNLAGGLAQLGLQEHEDTVASTTTETAVGTTASEREPSPAPSNEDSNATPPEPAAPGVKKPMSWAAIAKTPAKPAEVKPVVAPAAVKPPGIAPAIPITANGRAPVGAVATTGSWAAMAKAAGPVAPAAPKRIITGGGADDPKSRTNEMFAERGINPKNFNIKPNNVRCLDWLKLAWLAVALKLTCLQLAGHPFLTGEVLCDQVLHRRRRSQVAQVLHLGLDRNR